ncbi:MAG: hypothetical protein JW751_21170 [Polyangiaceae bacterium]|nr:hypothetical protein [Polyangiaceae bacterium]
MQSATAAPASEPLHDPAHPPIDCPLRKQGIDPGHLRPFDDIAKYIEFLERPDRAQWQKPDAVVAALDLGGDEVVFDVGAGSGYFSFRFAKAAPQGKVIAGDTEPEMAVVLSYVGASGVVRVPMTLFEMSFLGVEFALVRYAIAVPLLIVSSELLGSFLDRKGFEMRYPGDGS